MTAESTLAAVRELSENATRRPAPRRLRLAKREELRPGPQPARQTYEDAHPPRILGLGHSAAGYKPRAAATDHCPRCGKRPIYCFCAGAPTKEWMAAAVEKTGEAA